MVEGYDNYFDEKVQKVFECYLLFGQLQQRTVAYRENRVSYTHFTIMGLVDSTQRSLGGKTKKISTAERRTVEVEG